MKATTILTILLVASVCYNVYQYVNCRESKLAVTPDTTALTSSTGTTTGTDDCETAPPFAPAIVIAEDAAKQFFDQFTAGLVPPDVTTGGIISTDAFIKMMCDPNCNGIAYSFARDKVGTTGPADNGIFLILEAVKVDYDAATDKITAVNPISGAVKYRPGNWCPVNCMAWH